MTVDWGDGVAVLKAARISTKDPGVEIAEEVDSVHRKFGGGAGPASGLDRAAKVMASAVPPAS